MARTPTPAPAPLKKQKYFILDDKIVAPKIGAAEILPEGKTGWRYVMMDAKQAQYWVDQGAIGLDEPKGKKAEIAHAQMIGDGDDVISKRKGK